MVTASLLAQQRGLRPVQIRRDLRQIADLIELCFAHNMDSGGRAAVEEMRTLASLGPGLWLLQGLDRMVKGLMQGFVWIEENHVIGNVSIYPAGYDHTWAIANVAVHPDYRGRGIAHQLCQAALQRIVDWRGKAAILQVDADNEIAQRVYYRLGFYAERTFTRWYWRDYHRLPKPAEEAMPYITYPTWREWQQVYELAQLVRPNAQGGMGWLRPTTDSLFRPRFWNLFSNQENFIVRGAQQLEALLLTKANFGSAALQFDLLIHPRHQGRLEEALLNFVLRRASAHYRNAVTDHPTDDFFATAMFEEYRFEAKRSLIHMRWAKK